jgi:hypothetical protein
MLKRMEVLYQRLGEHEAWSRYTTGPREVNRTLRALKDKMAAAKL